MRAPNGETHYLCRAVDHEGEILESYVTKTRDKAATLALMRKTLKRHGKGKKIVTDGLRSYPAAMRELGNLHRQEMGRHLNNRAENSHLADCVHPGTCYRRELTYLTSILPMEASMGVPERITTVISTKGQVILPKAIRDQRHWAPGTRLSVEDTPDGVLLKATPAFPEATVDSVFGSLRHKGTALTVEEMDAAITKEAKRHARD